MTNATTVITISKPINTFFENSLRLFIFLIRYMSLPFCLCFFDYQLGVRFL